METLFRGGKSISLLSGHSIMKSLPAKIFRHEFHPGETFKPETISWHLLNPAVCLAAMDEWDDLHLQ